MPFEDAALGRRRPLLQLTGGPIAAQPKLQLVNFSLAEAFRPQQLPRLLSWISPTDRGRSFRALVLRRQTQMLIPTLSKHVTRKVGFMDALHDDHPRGGFGIVHSRRHHLVVPVADAFAGRVGLGFLHVVWIVANDAVAALTRVGASDRAGDPVPGLVIVETPLFVLVLGEHKNVSPVAPVPRRLDHGSALARIAQAEALGIAGIKPPPLGPARPFPARPEDAHRERLHV